MTTDSVLKYPIAVEPEIGDGSSQRVAPGVLWLRMPLFASLPAINVWVIRESASCSIVDTGIHSAATIEAWEAAFAGVLEDLPVQRVIATHMHADHCGMAGWMVERFKARLWMSRLEYLTCRLMAADTGRSAPEAGIQFYRAAGWDNKAIDIYRTKFGSFGGMIYPMPDSYRRISDGEDLVLGENKWKVVGGNGHSPEHSCLHCPELGLLISGDQVLPRISSNVSVYPTEPDANPLGDWLSSLASICERVPDDVLVLPAHNSPFVGLHARCAGLIASHRRGLDRLLDLLAVPKRAIDVFGALFSREIDSSLLGMATGEAIAHLNYLASEDLVTRHTDPQGVWWWRRN
jgi:glyoxylase-like metal-dependent hydrolase (beta-lactamase superfamily II)